MIKRLLRILAALSFIALAMLIWKLDLPNWQRLDLERLVRADTASRVYDASGQSVGTLDGAQPREWAPLSSVPRHVRQAFIAAEDLRFYEHCGVDVRRMLGALWHDLRTHSFAQGASTITQQLIKLTHLTQAKTLSRKAQEIVLALQLERALDKDHILEAYLNAVYFGHGAYGIAAAARTYFGVGVDELTLSEGALLAGVIKAPSNYAPHLNPQRALSRRNSILETMAAHDMISQDELRAARADAVVLADSGGGSQLHAWYMDALLAEAEQVLDMSAEEVLTGGLRVHTALSPDLQAAAEFQFEDQDRFPASAADDTPVQAALVALDPATGEISALIGGRRYEVQRGLNRATQARRQPGSAFKPISTYAAAVDAFGYVPASIVDDTPRTFPGGYAPGNAGGQSYGPVTLREALSRSLNIATVDLAETIGIDAARSYARRFGIALSNRDASLSLALGALTDGVSPVELGAAYCALANGGTRVAPHMIRRIEDAEGRVLYRYVRQAAQAVSPESAYMLTDMLKTAAATGSARALSACGLPVAGKTGTVSEPAGGTRDIWTVAYTPDVVTVVWMGFDSPDAEHALPASEGGGGYPARLCASFLESCTGSLSGRDFPKPGGVRTVLLDALALREAHAVLLSTERTPRDMTCPELFRSDNLPAIFSDNWRAPGAVPDFRCLTGPGEVPVLAFTAQDASAEYVLTRTAGGVAEEIAVLRGTPGEELRFADAEHDLHQPAIYTLIPCNANLHALGTLLTGPIPTAVQYAPGGLLNRIMGTDAAEAAPMPTDDDSVESQSLFS